MTYEQFIKLVTEMRLAQKAYFRARGHDQLREAKRLESEVDKTILHGPAQSMLFNDEMERMIYVVEDDHAILYAGTRFHEASIVLKGNNKVHCFENGLLMGYKDYKGNWTYKTELRKLKEQQRKDLTQ